MLAINTAEALNQQITDWKSQGQKIAFVPTMGNLHRGHLSLIKKATTLADKVVVSIYINPTQFGAGEDLDSYPRTLVADQKALSELSVDLLFLPSNDVMYAEDTETATQITVSGLSNILCGEYRPTHFAGVTTVVNKLFNLVQPDIAIFGEKDFQQVFIIKKMVADLFMPVKVISAPTVRESDGLAMSSRNQYLGKNQRQQAVQVYQTLLTLKEGFNRCKDFSQLTSSAKEILLSEGFKIDYVSFRSAKTLLPAKSSDKSVVLLIAAWLGKTRLIDNLVIQQ